MKLNRQSMHPGGSSSSSAGDGEIQPSALSHGMRAAAGSGIFGLGEVAEPSLSPSAPITPPPAAQVEGQGGAGTSGMMEVTNTSGVSGYRMEEVGSGRIGTRVGGWREADRERLV